MHSSKVTTHRFLILCLSLVLSSVLGYVSWQQYSGVQTSPLPDAPILLKRGSAPNLLALAAKRQQPDAKSSQPVMDEGIIPTSPDQAPPPGYYSKPQPDGTIRFVKKMIAKSPTKRVYPADKKIRPGKEMRQFFKKLGLVYTPVLLFSKPCQPLKHLPINSFSGYAESKQYYDRLADTYGRVMDLGATYEPPVYVKWVNDKVGYGVFAARDIKKGEFIVEYTGLISLKSKDTVWAWSYPINGEFIGYPGGFSLDATDVGNEARFVNHSRKNNVSTVFAYLRKQARYGVGYPATRDIEKDEEILTNYGQQYFRRRTEVLLE